MFLVMEMPQKKAFIAFSFLRPLLDSISNLAASVPFMNTVEGPIFIDIPIPCKGYFTGPYDYGYPFSG